MTTYYSSLLFLLCTAFAMAVLTSCASKEEMFRIVPESKSGLQFSNSVVETDSFNILTYPYILNGSGVAAADFNNDGLDDLFFVSNRKGGNKLYLNKGGLQFTEQTQTAGVQGKSDWSTGVAIVDINGDGWQDIYVSTVSLPGKLKSCNELYINEHNGRFKESAASYGLDLSLQTTQTCFFDADGDGDLDAYVLNHPSSFQESYADTAMRKRKDAKAGDLLLVNENGRYVDGTTSAGILSSQLGYGLGVAVGDLNRDGFPDIYVSNDFKENDYCYLNDGNGKFRDASDSLFGHQSRFSMGSDLADINEDGWPDLVTLDMLPDDERMLKSTISEDDYGVYEYRQRTGFHYQLARNCLQQNVGGRYFQDVALQAGVAATDWSWSALFGDLDLNGRKDLFVSNGFTYRLNDLDFSLYANNQMFEGQKTGKVPSLMQLIRKIPNGLAKNRVFLQDVEGHWSGVADAILPWGQSQSSGTVLTDLDNDGDLDIVVSRMNELTQLLENNTNTKHYIEVSLSGTRTNTNGIGATVAFFSGGKCRYVDQSLQRGFMSSQSPRIHIGMPDEKADSVVVYWPDGMKSVQTGVSQGSNIHFTYDQSVPGNVRYTSQIVGWNQLTDSLSLLYKHEEDPFNDFDQQWFLPHSMATEGPALAKADINQDGLEDVFLTQSFGKPGELWIQTKGNRFIQSKQACFLETQNAEGVDALFVDSDGDGDQDLVVVSGGDAFFGAKDPLKDHLYLNDGKGNFTNDVRFPALYENKSCVASADFDKDGDIDLFIGGRTNARSYGYHPASSILINIGEGKYIEATDSIAKGLQFLGMTTDAIFSDMNGDGWMDLVVVGEWMAPVIFINQKGSFVKQVQDQIPKGWWTMIYGDDFDGDGDTDLFLGNWGNNSKLNANIKHPLMMGLLDADDNGESDPLLCQFIDGEYYTFLPKNDLEKKIPSLRKKYLSYASMAGQTVEEIFTDKWRSSKKLEAQELRSAICWNNNGSMQLDILPPPFQVAPIMAVTKIGNGKWIAAGNFFDVLPYEGRYDAMLPIIFSIHNRSVDVQGVLPTQGQVRAMETIKLSTSNALMILCNDEKLKMYTTNQ